MIFLLLFLVIILEGSFLSFPIVLLFLLFTLILSREKYRIFTLAFASGIFLDAITFRNIGTTSIFFLIFLFGVLQYGRKFEIGSGIFIVLASFLGSFAYLSFFSGDFVPQKALFTCIVAFLFSKLLLKDKILLVD